MTGSDTALATLLVARTPTGSSPLPLTPPVPKPRAGFRVSTSITSPGKVFTTEIPSAPASAAVRAETPIAGRVGDNFTKIGLRVDARDLVTTSESVRASAPNSTPPALTFGQLTFSSYPATAPDASSR